MVSYFFTAVIFSQSSGQVVVGGNSGNGGRLSSVELFPPSNSCSIPDLPQPRYHHSLSLLSGVLVVCGGRNVDGNDLDSCISWVAGNASWTPLYTMRCLPIMTFTISFLQ